VHVVRTRNHTGGAKPPASGSVDVLGPAANPESVEKRWARIALYVLLGIVGLLAICVIVVLNTDLGRFQGQIEDAVTDALGRDFAIEGDLNVEVDLRQIRIAASDIRLAATEWSADADLARIGRFETVVDTRSLLNWPIRIESFDVERVRVSLERDEAGAGNWEFFEPEDEIPDDDTRPPGDLPVIVDLARIVDVALTYSSPERPEPLRFTVTELTVERDDGDYLDLRLDAALNDTPVGLDVRAGLVANLVEYRNVAVSLAGNLGEIKLDGEAAIDSLLEPQRPTLRLTVSGPSAEYLTEKLQVEPITRGPLELTASIAPLGDDMQLNMNGDVGEFAIDVSGQFENLQALENVSLRAAASGPNAGVIGRLLGNPNVPEDPFSVVASFTRAGPMIDVEEIAVNVGKTRFVVEARISDFRQPAGASGSIRIDGPDFGRFNRLLGLPGKLTGPFDMNIDLKPQPDGSAVVSLAANAEDLQFTIAGTVANTPDLSGTTLRVDFVGPDFRTVTDALGLADAPSKPFTLGVDVARVPEGINLRDGSMNIGDDRFGFAGIVGNAPLEADTDLSFEMQGPNLAATLAAFGLDADELPYAQYRAGGRIEREADRFVLHDIAAAIGDNLEYELHAEGTVTDHPDLIGTRVQLRVSGASLGALTDAAGIADMPDVPFQASASLERVERGFAVEDGRARLGEDTVDVSGLIGEKPLERDTNMRFAANAKDLKATLVSFGIDAGMVPAGDFNAAGEIRSRGSRFQLRDINASLAGARVLLSGELGAMPSLDGTNILFEVKGDSLARLLPEDENFAKLTDPFRVSASVRVRDEMLSLSDARVELPGLDATAAIEVGMAPVMGRGRFKIAASSPDLVPFTPVVEGLLLTNKLPLKLMSSGHWDASGYTLDELDLALAGGMLVGSGTVGGPPNFEGTDLNIDLNVASLRTLSALAGRELPDDSAQLEFHLAGSRGVMRLDRFDGRFGDSDISGDLAFRNADVPEIDIRLSSTRLNLLPYLRVDAEPAEEDSPPAQAKDRLIPDTPIPMDELKKVKASVNIDIKEINLGAKTFTGAILVGSLADGALAVDKFAVSNNVGGSLRGDFTLRPVGDSAALSLDLAGSNLILGMPAETAEELAGVPRYELDTVLVGSGATVRELAASLNGYLRLIGGEGRLRATALRVFTGDFLSEVVTTVNPFVKKDPYTNVQCAVALVQVENGKAVGKPILVAQTDRLRIFANADVDLSTEKFNADIRTVPQKGLGLSVTDLVNPYVKLGGTLANPMLMLDPEGALIEGGAAVATAGVSILAKRFKERFIDAKDACGKAVTDAEPKFAELRAKYRPTASPD
jgi:uncharacterized protein involved in outer membrane biogenesis